MEDKPMLYNPKAKAWLSATGGPGGPGISEFRIIANRRDFSKTEMPNVHTHVLLRLPFALHGFAHSYKDDVNSLLNIFIKENPINVAAYNLGRLEHKNVSHLKLIPDNWGYVNYTEAHFDIVGFRELSLPGRVQDLYLHDRQILRVCTDGLNKFLDWYSLATQNYSIQRVSPNDFVFYESWHTLPPDRTPFNYVTVHFPTSALSFEEPETDGEEDLINRALHFETLAAEHQLAYRLYAESRRSLEAGNPQAAAIAGASCLETALAYYIRSQVEARQVEPAIKQVIASYGNKLKNTPGLSLMLNTVFPKLLPANIPPPKKDVDACNLLREARNDAVHNPARFNPQHVAAGLAAVESLLGLLTKNE